jgi:hypothetical protein
VIKKNGIKSFDLIVGCVRNRRMVLLCCFRRINSSDTKEYKNEEGGETMKEEELIGEQRIKALRRNMIIPGTRLGIQSRGSKMYATIEAAPGVLTREQERALRALDYKVSIQRWGAKNFYIFFEDE